MQSRGVVTNFCAFFKIFFGLARTTPCRKYILLLQNSQQGSVSTSDLTIPAARISLYQSVLIESLIHMASVDKDPQLLFRPIEPPEAPDSFYNGFSETTQILPEGHQRYPRSRPFPKATIYERDQPIPMRDGVILRADIFRPADETTRVPAVLPWSPYGKSGTGRFSVI